MSQPLLARDDYLDFMSNYWDTYLASLKTLPDSEQQRFARAQGFPTLRDLLAHINEWWNATLERVPVWAEGESPDFDPEEFSTLETEIMGHDQNQPLAQVEEDFGNLRGQVAALIADLPDAAFQDERIAHWLHHAIITHYREYQPGVDPQSPSEKYERVYKSD